MNKELWHALVGAVIRKALAGFGASLVTSGYLTGDQWIQIVGGLAMVAVSLVWAIIQKYGQANKLDIALRLPKDSTIADVRAIQTGEMPAAAPTSGTMLLSIFLCCALMGASLAQVGCGAVPREKLVEIAGYGQQLAAQLVANETVPLTLFQQGVITKERLEFLNTHIATAKRLVARFNEGLTAALGEAEPSVRALVTLAADLVSEVQAIAADASPQWKKALAVVEISLRAIASYFASHVSALRKQFGRGADRVLARYMDVRSAHLIEEYAAGR